MSKDEIIKKVYFEPSGFGSRKTTLADSKKIDNSITNDDVKQFLKKNTEQKTQVKGYNSFIAPYPNYEYQVDLFFINDLPDQKIKAGMVVIDIFTKFAAVIPIKGKSQTPLLTALLEALVKMGKRPEIIYTDGEGGLDTTEMKAWYAKENLKHIVTLKHAYFAERFIRTFKFALYKRIDDAELVNFQWTDLIFQIMLTYNNKLKHSATGMTPDEAKKPKNEIDVKMNLLVGKKRSRIYPRLSLGDKVKVMRKKGTFEKERTSNFSADSHEIISITEGHGQKYYKLQNIKREYLRNELLKV
jgi:hypothetical protein